MKNIHIELILRILFLFLLILGFGWSREASAEDVCGNTLCETTESCITCATDCSCGNDFEWNCVDQIDNDIDALIDCLDADCRGELACPLIISTEELPGKDLEEEIIAPPPPPPPPLITPNRKSAAPQEQSVLVSPRKNLTLAFWQFTSRIPLGLSLGAFAILPLFLIYRRIRLPQWEDQDEW